MEKDEGQITSFGRERESEIRREKRGRDTRQITSSGEKEREHRERAKS